MQTLDLFSTDLLSEESNPFKSLADVTVGDVVCAMVLGQFFIIKVTDVHFMRSEIFNESGDVISSKKILKVLRFESENGYSPFGSTVKHTEENEEFFNFPEFELYDDTYFFETNQEEDTFEIEVRIDMPDSFEYNYVFFYFGKSAVEKYNTKVRENIRKKEEAETIRNGEVADKRSRDLVQFVLKNKSSTKPVNELIAEWEQANKPNE